MKAARYLTIASLLFTLFTSSKKEKKSVAPPGTIRVNDTLFADKTEISNIGWREFLFWIPYYNKDDVFYEQMLPDSSVWRGNHAPLQEYYFRHPRYNNYPVIGVSYEQATAFCKWRGEVVNQLYDKYPKENPFPGKKYRYRLPTIDEWEMITAGKKDITQFPNGYDSIFTKWDKKWEEAFNCKYTISDSLRSLEDSIKSAGEYMANYEKSKKSAKDSLNFVYYKSRDEHYKAIRPRITAPVESFKANGYNLYNTIGNVSEMTDIKGIAKGGNYIMPVEDCTIKGKQFYTAPTAWLGFRCVCVIVKDSL